MTARHLTRMPVLYAVSHPTQVELPGPPAQVHAALWAFHPTAWGAIMDCYNAGLRGPYLGPPEGWVEPLIH